MKYFILPLFLLFTLTAAPQKSVLIEGFTGQQIEVSDSIAEKTVKKFIYYMEHSLVDYEDALHKVKAVKSVTENRAFVSEFKNGIIYYNARLDSFPSTKEVVILHHLAANNGMETIKDSRPYVHYTRFNITERNEELFRRQLVRSNPYKMVVEKLERDSPLKSKL